MCESCLRAVLERLLVKEARSTQRRLEIAGIVSEIIPEVNVYSSRLFDAHFLGLCPFACDMSKRDVNKTPACTCSMKNFNGEVKYIDEKYAFSQEPALDENKLTQIYVSYYFNFNNFRINFSLGHRKGSKNNIGKTKKLRPLKAKRMVPCKNVEGLQSRNFDECGPQIYRACIITIDGEPYCGLIKWWNGSSGVFMANEAWSSFSQEALTRMSYL